MSRIARGLSNVGLAGVAIASWVFVVIVVDGYVTEWSA